MVEQTTANGSSEVPETNDNPTGVSSRRQVLFTTAAIAGASGCLSGGSVESTPTETTPSPVEWNSPTPSPTAVPTPSGPIELEPPFPETEQEIAQYREQRLAEHYDKHDNPTPEDATRIASLEELAEYAQKDDVHVKMEPGTYEITISNYDDIISVASDPYWSPRADYIHFSGDRSYWDLRGVKITAETRILNRYDEALSKGTNLMTEIYITAQDSIIRGLEYENVDKPGWIQRGSRFDPAKTIVNYGANNLFHDITVTARGSWPYGYGSMFGFSRNDTTLPLYKKAGWKACGYANLYVGLDIYQRAFSHALFSADVRKLEFIDCHIEGELRQTDEILAEKSGPAYEQDFPARFGDKLQPGAMISLCEDAFRSYPSMDGTAKILGCTVSRVREPLKFRGASKDVYIAQTTFSEHADKSPQVFGDVTMKGCAADFKYAPALVTDTMRTEGGSVDMTILPSPTAESITRHRWVRSDVVTGRAAAYLGGTDIDITLHAGAVDLQIGDEFVPIIVGWQGAIDRSAKGLQIENNTPLPVVLQKWSEDCTVQSVGSVEDNGTNNDVTQL